MPASQKNGSKCQIKVTFELGEYTSVVHKSSVLIENMHPIESPIVFLPGPEPVQIRK